MTQGLSLDTIRTFVAVDIGDSVRTALAAELDGLRREWPRVKWVTASNVHLTLAFLGHIYPEHVAAAGAVLADVAAGTPPFELAVGGLGCFGPARSPRVVWVGITSGHEPLTRMQQRLADGLRQIGLKPEDHPFKPHLTLGRVKVAGDATGLGDWLRAHADRSYGTIQATAVHLMSSELRPQGAVYATLKMAACLQP